MPGSGTNYWILYLTISGGVATVVTAQGTVSVAALVAGMPAGAILILTQAIPSMAVAAPSQWPGSSFPGSRTWPPTESDPMADQPLSALSDVRVRLLDRRRHAQIDVLDTSMFTTGTDKGITVATFLAQYLHAGSNITLTPGLNGVTIASTASGAVTSVGLTMPPWYSVAGSPVTSSGTLAVTAATGQTANQFVATPSGSSGTDSLRAIAAADLPAALSSPFSIQSGSATLLNVIPMMYADSGPTPLVALASSEVNTSNQAWNAFDFNSNTQWLAAPPAAGYRSTSVQQMLSSAPPTPSRPQTAAT